MRIGSNASSDRKMIPPHLDFKLLKRRVAIEQVLDLRGWMPRMRRRGGRLAGPCPVHGGDNPTAFTVHRQRQVWYCFTQCGRGGDVIELIRLLDGLSYRQAAQELARLARMTPQERPSAPATTTRRAFTPFVRRLSLDPHAGLLAEKQIAPQTARVFDAGAWRGRGFLRDCVGVRLHDSEGGPLGYAGRRLSRGEATRYGKWKFPPGFPKADVLFNHHRVPAVADSPMVVVECPWGVMRLWQLGLPAVALLGLYPSGRHRDLLAPWRHLVLMLDGDHAGRQATADLETLLRPRHRVDAVLLPEGQDPDDLHDDELLDRLLPFWSSSS